MSTYEAKQPKTTKCLASDGDALLVYHEFSGEHGPHNRTLNLIESTISTGLLRHGRTEGSGCRSTCLIMVFHSMEAAWRSCRLLD